VAPEACRSVTPPLAIEQVRTADLGSERMAEILHLCDAAYGEATEPYFEAIGAGVHLLGLRDAELVSHLMWVTRQLEPEGIAPLDTAYVELVATLPAEQGRGYATQLLRALPARLADFDLAALCPATDGLYLRAGWRFWRGPLSVRKEGARIRTPEERVMFLTLPRTPLLNLDAPLSVEWRPGEVW
jgi:aminoglycoside 2'-N-acetyltransferase I